MPMHSESGSLTPTLGGFACLGGLSLPTSYAVGKSSPKPPIFGEKAPAFVDRVAQAILAQKPRIVSCTSTFGQHVASLALLRRIRELAPEVITLIGGANCEGVMGLATKRAFDWVDFVFSGEGDTLFYDLCRKLLDFGRNVSAAELPEGAIGVGNMNGKSSPPRASVWDMDRVPIPDYDDYFEAIQTSQISAYIHPGLPVQTSRGCWWGQVHHCTFCGLNGASMAYRSKSPDRVVQEFDYLAKRYNVTNFIVVDNILDLKYIKTVLPELAKADQSYQLFFETKVNLQREQMATLAAAGIRHIQPGIESMHDEVLKLMDKGTTAIMNVQFLKWARELGIFVGWNFLWGLPKEQDEWYAEMAQWLPLITHLQPPGFGRIQYHRFSPYFQRPQEFGLDLEPYWTYAYVYPLPPDLLTDLAYYFEDKNRDSMTAELKKRPGLRAARAAVVRWNQLWSQLGFGDSETKQKAPTLSQTDDGQQIKILDTRPVAVKMLYLLQGLESWIYRLCDRARSSRNLLEAIRNEYQSDMSWDDIKPAIDKLRNDKLLLELNGKFLSLAVKQPVAPIPNTPAESPGGYIDIVQYQLERTDLSAAATCKTN
ncbi:RiPP maturation radical SAM C-methyltransferase [Microseira sp. BLCC-F43]|uniref:RiPP maturation radical SAM C-methyltransferase n=1 Tax=Microseira sp. BLCC-F43 TaxID=3153602 RepID=UPI0035B98943